jgi:hypothetical protein
MLRFPDKEIVTTPARRVNNWPLTSLLLEKTVELKLVFTHGQVSAGIQRPLGVDGLQVGLQKSHSLQDRGNPSFAGRFDPTSEDGATTSTWTGVV